MALHEITKGMDNASQAIMENFLKGSVVDSGSNENGSFVKLGSGHLICFHKADVVYANTNYLQYDWKYPAEYSQSPLVIPQKNASNLSRRFVTGSIGGTPMLSSATIRLFNSTTDNYVSGDSLGVYMISIGFYK